MPSDQTSDTDKAPERDIVSVGFPVDAGDLVRRAAARRHKKLAAFIRDAAIEAAERVISGTVMVAVSVQPADPADAKAA